MRRREFLGAVLGLTALPAPAQAQFIASGHFALAGQPGEGWFSLGQTIAVMINPKTAPTICQQAEALVGKEVEFRLVEKL